MISLGKIRVAFRQYMLFAILIVAVTITIQSNVFASNDNTGENRFQAEERNFCRLVMQAHWSANEMPTFESAEEAHLSALEQARQVFGTYCNTPNSLYEVASFYLKNDHIEDAEKYTKLLMECPDSRTCYDDTPYAAIDLMKIAKLREKKGIKTDPSWLKEVYERHVKAREAFEKLVNSRERVTTDLYPVTDVNESNRNQNGEIVVTQKMTANSFFWVLKMGELTQLAIIAEMYREEGNLEKSEEYFEKVTHEIKGLYTKKNEERGLIDYFKSIDISATLMLHGKAEWWGKAQFFTGLADVYYLKGDKERFNKFYSDDFTYIRNWDREKPKDMKTQDLMFFKQKNIDPIEDYRLREDPIYESVLLKMGQVHAGFGEYDAAHRDLVDSMLLGMDIVYTEAIAIGLNEEFYGKALKNQKSIIDCAIANKFAGNLRDSHNQELYYLWINHKSYSVDLQQSLLIGVKESNDRDITNQYKQLMLLTDQYYQQEPTEQDANNARRINELAKRQYMLGMQITALEADIKSKLKKKNIKFDNTIKVEDVTSAVPSDSVLIDIVKIRDYDFRKQDIGGNKYAAFIVNGNRKEIKLVMIGDADSIDDAVLAYLNLIKSSAALSSVPDELKLKELGRQLYTKIIAPISPYISDKIVFCPDGDLNLIPLEILVDDSGRFLIETKQITYINSVRDLLKSNFPKPMNSGIIFAAPDYGSPSESESKNSMNTDNMHLSLISRSLNSGKLVPLDETRQEADASASVMKKNNIQTIVYEGKDATEDNLMTVARPKVLHIATHGFFIKDEPRKESYLMPTVHNMSTSWLNPMMRSGLFLAGANRALAGDNMNGIITANQFASIDLNGTEIVILSACDTGAGDIEVGQGVFGLQRAVMIAGSKKLMMSHWQIPSTETTELMQRFYSKWGDTGNSVMSLREAQLEIIRERSNPFYWGAFTITGCIK